jgi:hypothetical protein
VNGNTASPGATAPTIEVSSNLVTNELQCKSNVPPPTLGRGTTNQAKSKKGQCATL